MIPKYSTYSFCFKGILAGENSTLKDVVSFSPLKVALKGRNSDGLKELRLFPRAPPVYHLKDASPGFFQERPPMVADRLKGGFLPQRYAMYVIMSLSGLWSYPFAIESSQFYDSVSYIFLCIPLVFLSFSQESC